MTAPARFKQSDKIAFRVDEAARALGISRSSFYAQVRAGELETFKWCGRTLVRRDVLEAAMRYELAVNAPLAQYFCQIVAQSMEAA